MDDRLNKLQAFLEGSVNYETSESAAQFNQVQEENKLKKPSERRIPASGFVQGSQAYEYAEALGLSIELQQHKEPDGTADLFHEPLIPRYFLAHDFYELFPMRFGGAAPDDAYTPESDHYEGAIAWDENHVLFPCPRGVCMIGRTDWQKGCRQCRGC